MSTIEDDGTGQEEAHKYLAHSSCSCPLGHRENHDQNAASGRRDGNTTNKGTVVSLEKARSMHHAPDKEKHRQETTLLLIASYISSKSQRHDALFGREGENKTTPEVTPAMAPYTNSHPPGCVPYAKALHSVNRSFHIGQSTTFGMLRRDTSRVSCIPRGCLAYL